MTDTINIGETVAQLEGLYNGYNSILADAKERAFRAINAELTDAQVEECADKLASNTRLQTAIVRDVRAGLIDDLGALDESILYQIVFVVEQKLDEKYLSAVNNLVGQKIEAALSGGLLERIIEQRIQQSQELNEFIDIAAAMSRVVNSVDRIQAMHNASEAT